MPDTDLERVVRDGQNVKVVHDQLRDAIVTGRLPAGTTTSQVALGSEFGVGRTTIREALRLLQREGLVIGEPNRRVRIAELSGEDAEALYFMRINLEAAAIRVTVPELDSRDLAELEGLLAQMDHFMRHKDWHGLREPHRVFHSKLVRGAGARVSAAIDQLFDHAERYRYQFGAGPGEDWAPRGEEHRAILDAVQSADSELAARRLAAHYAQTAKQIFMALDPEHDLSKLRRGIRAIAPGAETVLESRVRPRDV
jgi:DNA-binding GntR family transcriptional regulator